MKFNHDFLRKKIRAEYSEDNNFADSLGIEWAELQEKLSGEKEFTAADIRRTALILRLTQREVNACFFLGEG